ncbi:MAG: DUF2336 domain-containing protein [Phenylobacterium sp.]|uniref:DUF2336 domain-containing protein n=1 Tax=Phenylobacterium sp. TaxID=1871053 RepID=UPI002736801D|nr:DUF2336 domain-containing protein [Phenylobacterium sp.]MDP3174060.1 DUF2336 domain-containing protein [Phenylobacterium sp.]
MTDAAASTKLHDLIALAQEPSSERRRELMRGVTDLFFTGQALEGSSEMALFDEVLSQLAGEMEDAVRGELAARMSQAEVAPRGLLRKLARDESIDVARPVLEGSRALTDDDLLAVARTRGQDHLRAISQRVTVSEAVSEAIVERGDDHTLGMLLRNHGASLSRESEEQAVDRACENPALHEAVVSRRDLPADLLNEMYFVVEAQLRQQILERNAEMDPAHLDAALAVGRKTLAARDGALPADFAEAEQYVRSLRARNGVGPAVLAGFLRNRETTRFLVALCEMADIDFHTARRILERRELDALAIVCKAADFDRSLFLTFAVLILDREGNALGRAREYGELYEALARDVAQRTLRFWRLRRQTLDVAAA